MKTFERTRKSEVSLLESVIVDIRPLLTRLGKEVHRTENTFFDWRGFCLGRDSVGPRVSDFGECCGSDYFLVCDSERPENVGMFVKLEYRGQFPVFQSDATFLTYDEALADTDLVLILEALDDALRELVKPRKTTRKSPKRQAKHIHALATQLTC